MAPDEHHAVALGIAAERAREHIGLGGISAHPHTARRKTVSAHRGGKRLNAHLRLADDLKALKPRRGQRRRALDQAESARDLACVVADGRLGKKLSALERRCRLTQKRARTRITKRAKSVGARVVGNADDSVHGRSVVMRGRRG